MKWQPSATIDVLRQRAMMLARVRKFFTKRDILEVETPLMARATVTDPHIMSIPVLYRALGSHHDERLYLQTSPEYAMKRLLAAGSGPIFQLSKAFRQGEVGRLHNPEFTMLEWYRPGFDHHDLMNEIEDFFKEVFDVSQTSRMTVAHVFEKFFALNPHDASVDDLIACANKHKLYVEGDLPRDKNMWLDLLFTHGIEPYLGQDYPVFIYDYPASQAALAKIREGSPPVASRFEIYYKGIELANGFHELQDAKEQRVRFEKDLHYRTQHEIEPVAMDELFLSALQHGLPDCAGVAVGIDRLIMLVLGREKIADVLSFAFE